MKNGRTSYPIPEAILDDASNAADRQRLIQAWQACDVIPSSLSDERKERVRHAVMEGAFPARNADRPARLLHISARAVIVNMVSFQAVAAVLAILVAVSFILSPEVRRYSVPEGSIMPQTVVLPDGSTAQLAPGSILVSRSDYGTGVRRVSLVGEAFFDVRSNGTPFVVRTFNSETTVLGTKFSIRARPAEIEAGTDVYVAEGSVAVRSHRNEVILEAREKSLAPRHADQIMVEHDIPSENALAWLNGDFWYSNEPLGNVLDDLERSYGVRIDAPASIRLRPISLHKNTPSGVDELLGDISQTIKVKYRPTANGFEVYLP